MPCYYPKSGWRKVKKNGYEIKEPSVRPCGSCIGCRLDKARDWAVRCVHEASMHKENCFITLTYNDKNLPKDKSINKDELQRFFKRLRKFIAYPGTMPLFDNAMRIQYYRKKSHPKYGQAKVQDVYREIKYYAAGEYGDRLGRPHYHACIFGYAFKDTELLFHGGYKYFKSIFSKTEGHSLYTSKTLEEIWKNGFVTIGELTLESAGYVARYCMKKINGEKAPDHYGEKTPEFAIMSKGIGKEWYKKYKNDLYPKDYTHINGIRVTAPRYYDNLLAEENPKMLERIKQKRVESQTVDDMREKIENARRLIYVSNVKKHQTKVLKRSIHAEN